MKSSQLLEKFFERRHRQWKKECYSIYNGECRSSSPLGRPKGSFMKKIKNGLTKPSARS